MAEEMNRLTAHVGFEVDEKTKGINDIANQIKKINTASKDLATSFKTVESTLKKLSKISIDTNGTIVAEYKKTNVQLNEEAKQRTLKDKATSASLIANAKAMSAERIAIAKRSEQTMLNNNKVALEMMKTNNKVYTAFEKEEAKQRTLQLKSQLKIQEAESRNSNSIKREIDKEYTNFWKTELNKQDSLTKEHYRDMINSAKSAYSQMASSARSLSGISNMNTTLGGGNNRNQFGYAVANATLTVTGVRAVLNEFANVSAEVVEVEKNAINVQRIMGDTSKEVIDGITDSAIQIAKNTATQITDVQEIQNAWVRINDEYANNLDLLNKISEATAKLVHVGDIKDAEEAVKLLNSSILQFNMYTADGKVDIEEAIKTLDKWAYMADKTAMGTADEYGEAVSRFGGFAQSIGANMDDAIVLTSILGDRLAKTGEEAGTALKTIMSYLTRDKAIKLFEQLGLDSDGLSRSLMKTNTEFETFDVIMRKTSDAYNDAINSGNDVQAKAIQNAIGAVRQGDSSIALLKNWAEDSVKYYGMVNEAVEGSYLDEQNEKLMSSLSAQWIVLKNSMVEFGTAFARAGIMDGIESVMTGFGDLLHFVSQLNPEVLKFISTFTGMLIAMEGIKKLSKLSGIYDVFTTSVKYGTVSQRKQAEALALSTSEHLKNQLATYNNTRASSAYKISTDAEKSAIDASIASFTQKNIQFEALTNQYREGAITATQYMASVKALNIAEVSENTTTTQGIVADEVSNATKKSSVASTIALTVATKAQTIASKVFNGVIGATSAVLKSFLNPVFLITTAFTLLIDLFSKIKTKAEQHNDAIETAKQAYSDVQTELNDTKQKLTEIGDKIDELNSKKNPSFIDKAELDNLTKTNEQLQKRLLLLQAQEEIKQKDIAKTINQDYKDKNRNNSNRYWTGFYDINNKKIANTGSQEDYMRDMMNTYKKFENIKNLGFLSGQSLTIDQEVYMGKIREELIAFGSELDKYISDYGIDDEVSRGWNEFAGSIADVLGLTKETTGAVAEYKSEASSASNENSNFGTQFTNVASDAELLSKALEDISSQNGLIKGVKQEVEDLHYVSTNSLKDIIDKYPQLTSSVSDYLSKKITEKELIEEMDEAYQADLNSYTTVILGKQVYDENFWDSVLNNLSDSIKEQAEGYKIELGNYKNYNEAKLDMDKQYLEKLATLEEAKNFAVGSMITDVGFDPMGIRQKMLDNMKSTFVNTLRSDAKGIRDIMNGINTTINVGKYTPDSKEVKKDDKREKDKNKDKFSETIDWATNSIKNLQNAVDDAQRDLENADGYEAQIEATNRLIEAQKKLKEGYQASADSYKAQYDSIKGIDSYKKNIESGRIYTKQEFSDEKLFNLIEQATELWNNWNSDLDNVANTAQDITNSYEDINKTFKDIIGEVEDLQDDIMKALKEKYQADYDARVRELKEINKKDVENHNSRIKLLEEEIKKIEENTPTDKQNKLNKLNASYTDWLNDDSTLGKAKQKELLDQIKELKKEIRVDELETEIESQQDLIKESNELLDKQLDKYSDTYDTILKGLDISMSDKQLREEANNLITQNKEQEIITLLTNFGSAEKLTAIGTSIGKTAGDLIAQAVKSALSGYGALKDNGVVPSSTTTYGSTNTAPLIGGVPSVGPNVSFLGGLGTTSTPTPTTTVPQITNSTAPKTTTTTTPKTSTTTKDKTDTIQKGDTLWELAEQYYGNGSDWTKIAKENNISDPSKLKVGQKIIIPFLTGGYTGDEEGLAYLHKKERVLTERQTNAYDFLAYNFLPRIEDKLSGGNLDNNVTNNNTTFNKELVSVKIDKVVNNTPFDIQNQEDNMNRLFKKTLKESGVNIKL